MSNTLAKRGKQLLMVYFSKKEIFVTTRYEEMGMINVLPRKLSISSQPIDLEKVYKGHMVATLGRENNYIIFTWSTEFGLTQIKPVADEVEGSLIDLISWNARLYEVPSHIIITQKKEWDDFTEIEFQLGKNRDNANRYSQEEITIYSCTAEQQQFIWNSIDSEIESRSETEQDFMLNHRYAPK